MVLKHIFKILEVHIMLLVLCLKTYSEQCLRRCRRLAEAAATGSAQQVTVLRQQGGRRQYTAYPRRHETPFLDWNAEFRFAESRFSQPLYQ
jgi:hypothetical protein